jgi:hypothetical protein
LASLSPLHVPGCARLGIGRLNAFRLNVYEQTFPVYINGAPIISGPALGLLIEGAQVVHALNDQVDTAAFTARGWQPIAGQRIDVYSGDRSPERQLFGGRILETTQRYLSKAAAKNVVTDIKCIDHTWLLSRWKLSGTFIGASATDIIKYILTWNTQAYTSVNVQAGLPVIEAITFDNENVDAAITEICKQVGAYWFVDYQSDVHVFTVADRTATPITQAAPGQSNDLAISEDLSQVSTRIIGLGGGVGASVDVPAGATELPIDLGVAATQQWYPSSGGLVEVAAQRVTYAQLRGNTGRGAILGTGNAPSSAPALAPTVGAGLGTGTYKYAITHITASGQTLIGPVSAAQTGAGNPAINALSVRASAYATNPTYYPANANIQWRVSILFQGSSNAVGPQTGAINTGNKYPEIWVGPIATDPVTGQQYPSGLISRCPAKIIQIVFYRTTSGGTTVKVWDVLNGISEGVNGWLLLTGDVTEADLPLQGGYPAASGGTQNQITVTLPAVPSPSVTYRGLYRTAINGSALKLVSNIAVGTATYVDAIPDASLTAAPPATDTSLLREDGQITVGATSALVTDVTPFLDDGGAAGGWASIGNLPVRYTGISGSNLTGIPSSGSGSVTSTVRYGAQVVVQARLVGIPSSGTGSLTRGARKGDMVALRLEVEDTAAMQAMADRLGQSGNLYAGLIEYVVNDSRLGPTELLAVIRATLAERKDPIQTVTYWTRDDSHDVGRLVTITTSTPVINGTFRIQRVTFSEIAIAGARTTIRPKRTIDATNKLYIFSDLLRQITNRDAGAR